MITTTEIERNQKAWELVRRLAQLGFDNRELAGKCGEYLEDFDVFACAFCHEESHIGDDLGFHVQHKPDCIWLQALQLVEGE